MKIILNAEQNETVANLAQTVEELAGSDKYFSKALTEQVKERIKAVQRRLVPLWDEDTGTGIPIKVKMEIHLDDVCWPWSQHKNNQAEIYSIDSDRGFWEKYEEKAKKKREEVINFVQGEIDAIRAEIEALSKELDMGTENFWHEFLRIY